MFSVMISGIYSHVPACMCAFLCKRLTRPRLDKTVRRFNYRTCRLTKLSRLYSLNEEEVTPKIYDYWTPRFPWKSKQVTNTKCRERERERETRLLFYCIVMLGFIHSSKRRYEFKDNDRGSFVISFGTMFQQSRNVQPCLHTM